MTSSGLGQLFSKDTQSIFFNFKQKPVQRMLDFDFLCGACAWSALDLVST
jgi:ATP citrate (pro-S)-lyase